MDGLTGTHLCVRWKLLPHNGTDNRWTQTRGDLAALELDFLALAPAQDEHLLALRSSSCSMALVDLLFLDALAYAPAGAY